MDGNIERSRFPISRRKDGGLFKEKDWPYSSPGLVYEEEQHMCTRKVHLVVN